MFSLAIILNKKIGPVEKLSDQCSMDNDLWIWISAGPVTTTGAGACFSTFQKRYGGLQSNSWNCCPVALFKKSPKYVFKSSKIIITSKLDDLKRFPSQDIERFIRPQIHLKSSGLLRNGPQIADDIIMYMHLPISIAFAFTKETQIKNITISKATNYERLSYQLANCTSSFVWKCPFVCCVPPSPMCLHIFGETLIGNVQTFHGLFHDH